MDIVFCCDRRVLAGLHVAARSVLMHLARTVRRPTFWIFSDDIKQSDLALLDATLQSTERDYTLQLRSIETSRLQAFPKLGGSFAAYYRLLVPAEISSSRFVYLDVDTLCKVDLSEALKIDLGGHPIALCSECPMGATPDKSTLDFLPRSVGGYYFNSGVMVVDREVWQAKNVSEKCLNYLSSHHADYHDQTAINCVLHGDIATLATKFNCYTNVRDNWPALKPPRDGKECLLHFVDFPKPWSHGGRWVHPFGMEWWRAYRQTAHYRVGSSPGREVALKWRQWPGYKKSIKDRLLFSAYSGGWLRPKGVPPQ